MHLNSNNAVVKNKAAPLVVDVLVIGEDPKKLFQKCCALFSFSDGKAESVLLNRTGADISKLRHILQCDA
jgi:hypothetical protein